MPIVKKIRNYVWDIDPGYFNLKLASRTVLAIVISLWLLRDEALLTKVMGAIASGFSMQGVVAKTWSMRFVHVVIFSLAYFAMFALGLVVRDSANLTAVTLVALGFCVNYIRRFGLDNSSAPMSAWVLCFLATILPFADAAEAWSHIYGLLVGLAVSATVLLFIFPDSYPRLFISNSNRFFKIMAEGMGELRRYVLMHEPSSMQFTDLPFVDTKITLAKLVDSNQTMQQSRVFADHEQQIHTILIHQYGLLNAYSLMIDAYQALWLNKQQLSRSSCLALSQISKQFNKLLQSMKMYSDYQIHAKSTRCFLPGLAKKLGHTPLTDPALVMVLLNFKLSFDLLNQHLAKLIQDSNET